MDKHQPAWHLVDVSSLAWYCLKAGKDVEFGYTVEENGRKFQVNSWQYGLDNAINSLTNAWENAGTAPHTTIMAYESGNTKGFRRQWLETYKADKNDRAEAEYEQFNILREKLIETVRGLGGMAVTRAHMEGDDMLAYLVGNLQGEKVVQTQDGDLCVLLENPDVTIWRDGKALKENPYGPFDPKHITLYKALVGDASDKIPGAAGFGPKAWLDFFTMFDNDGLEQTTELVETKQLAELEPNVADLKAIQKILDNRDMVYKSYACAKLYPDQIESLHVGIEWKAGYVKQRNQFNDERLTKYAGTTTLVHAGNFEKALASARKQLEVSPFVALDIETSTPQESDDWLQAIKDASSGGSAKDEDDLGVDVVGSELTGMSLTFGENMQHTVYITVDHLETETCKNVTVRQALQFVKSIRKGSVIAVHNAAFELPVLFNTWGDLEQDNGWHGFLPNVHDTMVLASYFDENSSRGLKKLTKRLFDYDQTTYQEVTQGKKMNQLPAQQVLAYGADDTIMTAGLYTFFKAFVQSEQAWNAYVEVETLPAYVTATSFVRGFKPNLEHIRKCREEDAETLAKNRKILDDYLISVGWEGTVTPVFTAEDLDDYKKVKEIYALIVGEELKTQMRTASKIVALIKSQEGLAQTLAVLIEEGKIDVINKMIADRFDGTPVLDTSSPKQMAKLLYDVMGLKPRLINKLTDANRANKPLADACYAFNKLMRGSQKQAPLTNEQWALVRTKATTDKYAVMFAIEFDGPDRPDIVPVLKAIQEIATCSTRFSLFYNKYPLFIHWKTGRVHPHLNQCAAVTRRYSASAINVQQMSKRGEGVKVRGFISPHVFGGWIVSEDFSGQELRLGADLSGDPNMVACYVGDNLKDIHSIMASHPLMLRLLESGIQNLADKYSFDLDESDPENLYKFFRFLFEKSDAGDKKAASDLRKLAKNVVFLSQYGGTAPTLARQLVCVVSAAETLLQAKHETFKVYDEWMEEVIEELRKKGYLKTYKGARRHLREHITASDKWVAIRAERQGPNFMVQGSAAEMSKLAMAEMWRRDLFFKYDCDPIAPVHDEMVVSSSDKDLLDVARVLHECMTIKYLKNIPTVASVSFGRDFSQQVECGDFFDKDAILAERQKILEREAA